MTSHAHGSFMATSPTAANVTCKKQGQPSFGGCLPAFHDVFIYMCIYIYCESLHTGRKSPSPAPAHSQTFSQAAKMVNVVRLPSRKTKGTDATDKCCPQQTRKDWPQSYGFKRFLSPPTTSCQSAKAAEDFHVWSWTLMEHV